jgi:hypothetical protein
VVAIREPFATNGAVAGEGTPQVFRLDSAQRAAG